MKTLLDKIQHIGIDETVAASDVKYIVLVNSLSFVSVCLALGFIAACILYLPETPERLVNIYAFMGSICALILTPLINHYKYHLSGQNIF